MCVHPHSTCSTTSSEAELTEQETILPSIFESLDCYPNTHLRPRQTKAKTLSFLYSKDAFGFQAPDLWWMGIPHPQFENTFPPGLRPTMWNFLAVDSLTSWWKCFISSSKPHTAASNRCFTKYHLFDRISPKLKVWCRLWDHQKCFGWSFSPGSCHQRCQGLNLREQNMVGFHHLDGSGSSLNQTPEEPWQTRAGGTLRIMFQAHGYTQGFETEGQRDWQTSSRTFLDCQKSRPYYSLRVLMFMDVSTQWTANHSTHASLLSLHCACGNSVSESFSA